MITAQEANKIAKNVCASSMLPPWFKEVEERIGSNAGCGCFTTGEFFIVDKSTRKNFMEQSLVVRKYLEDRGYTTKCGYGNAWGQDGIWFEVEWSHI